MRIKSTAFALGVLSSLLLLTGCSPLGASATTAAATATPTLAPSPTPRIRATYTSSDGVYTVMYDPDWTIKPETSANTSGAVAISYDARNDLLITLPLTLKTSLSYVGLLNSFLTGAKATDIQVNEATSTAQLPSGTWTVASGTATIVGKPSTIEAYGTVHDDKTFVIFTVASSATAQDDQATYLQPMLQSLTFQK